MQQRPHATDWPSISMIVLCAISILFLMTSAGLLVFSGLFQFLIPSPLGSDPVTAASSILLGIAAAAGGLLVSPALYYNWQRLNGKPVLEASIKPIRFWQILILLAISLASILLGDLLLREVSWTAILAPVFYLPAVTLPIIIIVWISVGGLEMGSRRRTWSIFTLGMVMGPTLIMVVEIIIIGFLFTLGILYIALQPELMDELVRLSEQLINTTDPQAILELLLPYLTHPLLLAVGFIFISILIPLIEELLKPAGLWLISGKAVSPQAGFTLGILSGAAFAVFESLGNGSNVTDGWGMLIFARIGTDLVHILGTGLMGWAMAATWQDKKYLRLLGIYLVVVLNHGLWNAQAILVGVNELAQYLPNSLSSFTWISPVCVIGLSVQSILMIAALAWMNRRLRPKAESASESVV